jgi:hypothetical protein
LWAGYAEQSRSSVADKFEVAPPDFEASRHTESAEMKRYQRAVAAAAAVGESDGLEEGFGGFGEDFDDVCDGEGEEC